jgi:DNA-binding response OmpR family regulator
MGEFNILIIEDDLAHSELAKECFDQAKLRCQVDVVEQMDEALAHLSKKPADLIFLDLNLPRDEGRKLLRDLKEDPALRSIPVVVLTSSGSESDVVAAYELGASAYSTKPLTFGQFHNVIKQIDGYELAVEKVP